MWCWLTNAGSWEILFVWNNCADCGRHKCKHCWEEHQCALIEVDQHWVLHTGLETHEGQESHISCELCAG